MSDSSKPISEKQERSHEYTNTRMSYDCLMSATKSFIYNFQNLSLEEKLEFKSLANHVKQLDKCMSVIRENAKQNISKVNTKPKTKKTESTIETVINTIEASVVESPMEASNNSTTEASNVEVIEAIKSDEKNTQITKSKKTSTKINKSIKDNSPTETAVQELRENILTENTTPIKKVSVKKSSSTNQTKSINNESMQLTENPNTEIKKSSTSVAPTKKTINKKA